MLSLLSHQGLIVYTVGAFGTMYVIRPSKMGSKISTSIHVKWIWVDKHRVKVINGSCLHSPI